MTPARAAVFLACGSPLLKMVLDGVMGNLGSNPVEEVLNRLGFWALTVLLVSLAATPAKVLGWKGPLKFRRMLGLWAFAYAALHFLVYALVDKELDLGDIVEDVTKRPFILVGSLGLATLVPLAVTSTAGWVQRLGARGWKRLHRLAYVAAALGVVHFYMRVKSDVTEPATLGAVLAVLLLVRVVDAVRRRREATG